MPDGFAEQILDSLPDAVISHSPSGTITFWNRAAEALFGYRACEAVGRSVNVLIPDDITAMPATVRVNDARRVHIVWTLFPMHGVDGEVLGLTRIARVTADPDREEQRSAFLMRLDDEIRKLSDPKEITAVASRLLCEYLGADRCSYAEIDVDAGYVDIVGNYSTTLPDIQGRYALSSFGPGFRTAMQADRPYVFRDAVGELPPQVFAAYRALHIAAVMAVPLVKNQRLVAGMGVHQSTPRNWQMHEIELVRMVGSRCWESIERARVQRELQASEQMFRSMVEAAAEGIWMVDNENTTTFVNPRVTELLGYPASEMLGRSCFAFLHPEELHRGQAGLERRKSANDRTPRDYRFVRKDGEVRWLSFVGSPMHDGAGRVTGVLTMCMDSTERHVSEQRIRELNRELAARLRELETLLRVVPVGIAISYDTESQRVQRNPEAERMHGPHFRDGVAVPGEELPLQQAAKHGVATRDSEYEIVRPDGSVMEVLCSASPIFDSEGKPHGSVAALLDITDRKSIENALRRANGVLEQFAYAAAHDLQEPARNVSIYAQLLVREYQDRLDDRALQQMKLLVDSAQRMQNLIHDLLSYARATNDEDITPCGEADGNAVFAEVVENLHTAILQSEAIVTAKELPRVPGVRHGHLVQLLQNLVSNSLKYRGKGAPRVCISAAQQGAEFLFRVTDNGVGIAPEFHDRIFGVFKRLHGRNIPGTGIGLAVCERIVSHYGGRIWVESEAGRGATFLFTLPAVKKSG